MPTGYFVVHLSLTLLCAALALRLPTNSRAGKLLAVGLLAAVLGGLAIERRSEWSWAAMSLGWKDIVFFTNLTLEGLTVLLLLMWRQATTRGARVRAAFLCLGGLVVLGWSYGWYFKSPPAGLHGAPDATGFCPQTSDDSCSAAAAAMLLYAHEIRTDEAQMARLCLTRSGLGTPSLGLYRGVAARCSGTDLTPRLVHVGSPSRFHSLGGPAIISVGIDRTVPAAVASKMEEYGWQPGVRHAVVVTDSDPNGAWIDVSDPSYHRERWPTKDLQWLWDGWGLILARR